MWHEGLQSELKNTFPYNVYVTLKSYLSDSYFQVKYQDEAAALHKIRWGVPQYSVFGAIMHILYTADLPITVEVFAAIFAGDSVVITSYGDLNETSRLIQESKQTSKNMSM